MINEKAISLPFTIGVQGTVQTTNDQAKIWQDRVFSVISTGIGERINRYLYGTKIFKQQFEGIDAASEGIKQEISSAFVALLPLLTLTEVITEPSLVNGTISVTVRYKLPNNQESTVSLGNISLDGNNPLREN